MTKTNSPLRFFTASEAARACGICRNTLLSYEDRGIVAPARVGTQRAFTTDDIATVQAHRAQQAKRRQ